jgi:hypothetical protein
MPGGYLQSAKSHLLHYFNDHSTCGTWCQHIQKGEAELKKLKKYRCKQKNTKNFTLIARRWSIGSPMKQIYVSATIECILKKMRP